MLHIRKRTIPSFPTEFIMLGVLWALPLVYVPNSSEHSITARWGIFVAMAATLMVVPELRHSLAVGWRSLNRLSKVFLLVFVFMMLISTIFSLQSWSLRIVGWSGEYMGLLSWLSFVLMAVAFRAHFITFLASRLCLVIGGLVCVGSVLVDARLLEHGFRLPGLLFVPTSMAIYAALMLGVALWHIAFTKRSRVLPVGVAAISSVVLILCQSRAGQFAALVGCLLYVGYLARKKSVLLLAPLAVAILLVVIPLLGSSYFTRMRSEQVGYGLAYRADIYRLSSQEILQDHPLVGLGPSGTPQAINDRKQAPPGILETLNQRYVFLSAHDVFLDAAIMFGLLGGLALLALVLYAGYALITHRPDPHVLLAAVSFIALLANGLFNISSVQLTGLLFVATIAVLPSVRPR